MSFPFSPPFVKRGVTDVLCVGDSLTLGIQASPRRGIYGLSFPNNSYPVLLAALLAAAGLACNVWDIGVGSATVGRTPGVYVPGPPTFPVLQEQIQRDVIGHLQSPLSGVTVPSVVVLWAGINDLLHPAGINPFAPAADIIPGLGAQVWVRLQTYIASLLAAGVQRILICTLPPNGTFAGLNAQIAVDREQAILNGLITNGWRAAGCYSLIPLATLAAIQPSTTPPFWPNPPFGSDSLHYTSYTAIATFIAAYVIAAINNP